jgi:hypothetical protein
MDPKNAVIEAVRLHNLAGEELLRGRLHRAKAYILDALRLLREAAEADKDKMYIFNELVRQLDELYHELYAVDPRSATANELDRYRWRLHRLIEDFAFKTLDAVEGIVEIPVDGWVDRKAAEFAREFIKAKKVLEDTGFIIQEDRGSKAYVIGNVAFVKVGSSRGHAAKLWYDSKVGGYVLRYHDNDRYVIDVFEKLVQDFGGRVLERGENYIDVFVPEGAFVKAARALALMASEDIRQFDLDLIFGKRPNEVPEFILEALGNEYKRFIEEGVPPRYEHDSVHTAHVLYANSSVVRDYLYLRKRLKRCIARGECDWITSDMLGLLASLRQVAPKDIAEYAERLRQEIRSGGGAGDAVDYRERARRYLSLLDDIMRMLFSRVVRGIYQIDEISRSTGHKTYYGGSFFRLVPHYSEYRRHRRRRMLMAA